MKTIVSRQNPYIVATAKLKLQKERKKQQKFVAEGLRACKTIIDSDIELHTLFSTQTMLKQAKKLASEEKIIVVSEAVMEKISSAATPSGILGLFKIPAEPSPNQLGPGTVLAKISNPGNMGTAIRSCAAFGFTSAVIVDGADPWAPKVVQASAGTIANLHIFQWTWEKLIKSRGSLQLVALVAKDGKKINKINLKNSLLVVGGEAHGIPKEWTDKCDNKATIEMPGKTESLNAAVAGSIAMFLAYKQSV